MQKKVLPFPSQQILSSHASLQEMYELSPEAKREIASKLVVEAAALLKTLSDKDAAVAELLIDCLRLHSNQAEEYFEMPLSSF